MNARMLRLFAVFMAVALLAAACNGETDADPGTDAEPDDATGEDDAAEVGTLSIGSADFDENEIVASMYLLVLEDAGYDVEERFLLGTREVYFPALEGGEIDLIPEYTGTAITYLTDGEEAAPGDTDEAIQRLRELLTERDLTALEPADAQNANGLVVTGETADNLGLETVSDLEGDAPDLILGGPPECPERPLCLPGYEETYGLTFGDFQPLDAGGPVTAQALEAGDIDVAVLFTTDQLIAERDWVLLEDDQDLQPAENLVPVIRQEAVTDEIRALLDEVSAALTTEELTELNGRVRTEGEDPMDVAEDWLTEQGVLG